MTEFNWDLFDDEEEQEPAQTVNPSALPKELRKVIREAKNREKTLAEENETLKRTIRDGAVSSVLTSRNVPAKVAKLIPSNVEATPEAIGKWLDEYGDVFGVQQTVNPSTSGGDIPAAIVNTVEPNADIAAMQRIQNTAATGESLGGTLQKQLDAVNDPNLTEEQLDAMIEAAKAALKKT